MGPAFLVFIGIAVLVGLPLAAGAIGLGVWLRRTNKTRAFSTWIGAALSGAFAYFLGLGAIAVFANNAVRDRYAEFHPHWPIWVIALVLPALGAGLACAFFVALTLWRLVEAPPAQPVRTT